LDNLFWKWWKIRDYKWSSSKKVTMIGDASGNLIIINYNVWFFENINYVHLGVLTCHQLILLGGLLRTATYTVVSIWNYSSSFHFGEDSIPSKNSCRF